MVWANSAVSWSCAIPNTIDPNNPQSEAELMREQSLQYAEYFGRRDEGDLIVLGRFTKTDEHDFFHLEQLDQIRGMYWPRSESTTMPSKIQY